MRVNMKSRRLSLATNRQRPDFRRVADVKETRCMRFELFLAVALQHMWMMRAPKLADVEMGDELQILFANPLQAAVIRP